MRGAYPTGGAPQAAATDFLGPSSIWGATYVLTATGIPGTISASHVVAAPVGRYDIVGRVDFPGQGYGGGAFFPVGGYPVGSDGVAAGNVTVGGLSVPLVITGRLGITSAAHIVAGLKGSAVASGKTPITHASAVPLAPKGAVTISGKDATTRAHSTIAAGAPRQITITPWAGTVAQGSVVEPDPGRVTLSGNLPTGASYQNLLLSSEDSYTFDASDTVDYNSRQSPVPLSSFALVTLNGGGSHRFQRAGAIEAGKTYTLSIVAEYISLRYLFFRNQLSTGSGGLRNVCFDLMTGEVVFEGTGLTGSVENLGGRRWRLSVTGVAPNNWSSSGLCYISLIDTPVLSDGYPGTWTAAGQQVYLTALMMNEGPVALPYVRSTDVSGTGKIPQPSGTITAGARPLPARGQVLLSGQVPTVFSNNFISSGPPGEAIATPRPNLLTDSWNLNSSSWTIYGGAYAESAVAPDGTITAQRVVFPNPDVAIFTQNFGVSGYGEGTPFTLSALARRRSAHSVRSQITTTGPSPNINTTAIFANSGEEWVLNVNTLILPDSSRTALSVRPARTLATSTGADEVTLWNIKLEQGFYPTRDLIGAVFAEARPHSLKGHVTAQGKPGTVQAGETYPSLGNTFYPMGAYPMAASGAPPGSADINSLTGNLLWTPKSGSTHASSVSSPPVGTLTAVGKAGSVTASVVVLAPANQTVITGLTGEESASVQVLAPVVNVVITPRLGTGHASSTSTGFKGTVTVFGYIGQVEASDSVSSGPPGHVAILGREPTVISNNHIPTKTGGAMIRGRIATVAVANRRRHGRLVTALKP